MVACISSRMAEIGSRPPSRWRSSCSSRRRSSRACASAAAGDRSRRRRTPRRPGRRGRRRPSSSGRELEPKPVGAVDADAGHLAGGVQPGQRGGAVDVGVRRRPSCSARPAAPGSARGPGRCSRSPGRARGRSAAWLVMTFSPRWRRSRWTTWPYGESTVRPFSTSLTKACDSRSRGPSSMLLSTGVGLGLAEVVVLQVAVAILVEQPAALGPGRLGDEDAGERQAGRVVLDELHVLERRARRGTPGPCRHRS